MSVSVSMAALEKRLRKMFAAPQKGETFELRNGLVSQYAHERKDAIQRTIAAMTVGKDVSSLFPDVLKNIATHDLDQKKLVYLYLMNYAKSHPELVILAVNTFVQDSEDPNPLVRALAIRTMGCIRVDKMVDYMNIPLRRTLKDSDPYVRKTAAIGVAKLFDLNPEMCIEEGFLDDLKALLDDGSAMVVANTVSALSEIQESAPYTNCLDLNTMTINKLLSALNECTEWGRIAILSALADYKTTDFKEAEHICERVVPQFQHSNPSVVLASIKAVIAHLGPIEQQSRQSGNGDLLATLKRKMGPPLVTLVSSSSPEVQYVALRNIRIVVQKFPHVLSKEIRVFFCKYNDPPYLKFEKLDIMVLLAAKSNIDQLLAELREYSLEIDVEFVKKAIRVIGKCAIRIDEAAEKCVVVLMDLLESNSNRAVASANYVLQEVVIVMKDILRRYPKRFDGVVPLLCQSVDEIDETDSKAAIIWIIGEYCESIPTSHNILNSFASTFLEESANIQLSLLTACAKFYIKTSQGNELIQGILSSATSKSDNADIRDRAYIYWRLLSTDSQTAKNVILANRPLIEDEMDSLPASLLEELLSELSTLASVYHKPMATFIGKGKFGADAVQKRAIEEQVQLASEEDNVKDENLLDLDFTPNPTSTTSGTQSAMETGLEDIFGTTANNGSGSFSAGKASSQDILDLFGAATSLPQNENSVKAQGVPQATSTNNGDDLLGLF